MKRARRQPPRPEGADVAKLRSWNQVTASAGPPASMMALRAFIDMVTTCARSPCACRSVCAKVGTRSRFALCPSAGLPAPYRIVGDAGIVGARRLLLLVTMPPLVHDDAVWRGSVPVPIVACPGHVTVLKYGYAAFRKPRPRRADGAGPRSSSPVASSSRSASDRRRASRPAGAARPRRSAGGGVPGQDQREEHEPRQTSHDQSYRSYTRRPPTIVRTLSRACRAARPHDVAREHDEIGQLAGLDRAEILLGMCGVGGADVNARSASARSGAGRAPSPPAVARQRLPRDRGIEAEQRVRPLDREIRSVRRAARRSQQLRQT